MDNIHPEDMIFVFGSNLSGIHGAGAAKFALKKRGAEWGMGSGPMGQSYALPTKGAGISFMPLKTIGIHVREFGDYALRTKDRYKFQVTRVGTGLAGFSDEHIANLFVHLTHEDSPCYFDTVWQPFLPETAKFWGTG